MLTNDATASGRPRACTPDGGSIRIYCTYQAKATELIINTSRAYAFASISIILLKPAEITTSAA
jgi:hypothetical protein